MRICFSEGSCFEKVLSTFFQDLSEILTPGSVSVTQQLKIIRLQVQYYHMDKTFHHACKIGINCNVVLMLSEDKF